MKLNLFLFSVLIFSLHETIARRSSGGSRSGGSRGSGGSGGSRGGFWGGGSSSSSSSSSRGNGGRPSGGSFYENLGSRGNSFATTSRSYTTSSWSFTSKPRSDYKPSYTTPRSSYGYNTKPSAPKLSEVTRKPNSFTTKATVPIYFPPSNNKPPSATSRPEYKYRTSPSAPKFGEPSVTQSSVNKYRTSPSAPKLGGNFGSYNEGLKPRTEKPYAPPGIFKPKIAPYPVGSPQGLHPIPSNTGTPHGSSITASKYPQVSSGSSPYNPYYNPGSSISASKYPQVSSGSSPYNPYYNPGSSISASKYPQVSSGSSPYNPYYNPGSHPYPSGTNPGYNNYGHSPNSQPPAYHSPGNSGYPGYATGGSSVSQPGVVYIPSSVSSSRGTGDIFKEALIHSTVNAGVNAAANRIFYPSRFSGNSNYGSGYGSGYGYGGSYGGTTHIVHNNYYNSPPSSSQGIDNDNRIPDVSNNLNNINNLNSGQNNPNSNQNNPNSNPNNPNSGQNNLNSNPNNPNSGQNNLNSNPNNPNSGQNNLNSNPNNPNSGQNNPNSNNANHQNNPSNLNGSNGSNSSNYTPGINNGPHNSSYQRLKMSDDELRNLTEDLFSRQEFDVNKYIRLNLQTRVNGTNITDESSEPLLSIDPEANKIPTIELIRSLYGDYKFDSREKEKLTPEKIKAQNNLLEVFLQTDVMSGLMKWMEGKNLIEPDMLSRKEILSRIWFTPIEGSTSAFERTFLAENYWNTTIMGLQNWIYFNHAESSKEVNYLGYIEKLDLGEKGSLLKIIFKSNEIVQPTTVFIGTLPELEMALYTVCFFVRPNELCPVSLGGAKFNIFTHTFHSWGTDLLDVAVPIL